MSYTESLRVFLRVSELGSITAGGRDLRLTPAVASKRIRELETRLGVRLFNRTTRKLTPTEVGREFYDHARKVILAIDEAEAAVAGFSGNPRGLIRVAAPLGVGRRVIAPLVPVFSDLYPEIAVHLRLSDRRVDIFEDQIDVAFFLGTLNDSSLRVRRIAECDRVLCAAPGYLDRNAAPHIPGDLIAQGHNCLLLRFPRSPEYSWTLMTDRGPLRLDVRGRYDCDDGDVLTQWALEGRGIANRPRFDVAHHLASGALVEVLADTPPLPSSFACLYPHRRHQDPKVRLFVDFMIRRTREALAGTAASQRLEPARA